MAALTYLDTHVAVWLFVPRLGLLSAGARRRLERDELRISPAVLLELQYLREIGRLAVGPEAVVESLGRDLGLRVCDHPFRAVAAAAAAQSWTRDPFDRLIAGQAITAGGALLTRDETILANVHMAEW